MSEIPQSNALAEATTDSITELFSRDPEGLKRQDRDRIIEFLRAQRARIEATDKVKPAIRAAGTPKLPLSSSAKKDLSDMDL